MNTEEQLLSQITEIMKHCGNIMLTADRSSNVIESKEGHANFVTKYDKMIQDILEEKLIEILPEAVFVGEESGLNGNISNGYAYIVDPIDGTTNFIKDYKASAISVGLLKDGAPYIAAVYNPYLDEMFTAIKGQGAKCNDKSIHISGKKLSEGLVLFGTAPYYEDLAKKSFEAAYELFKDAMDLRRSGSAALDLCSIAAGRAEVYFELILQPWDYAAGCLIVTEAGGTVTTYDGNAITFDKPCSIKACGTSE